MSTFPNWQFCLFNLRLLFSQKPESLRHVNSRYRNGTVFYSGVRKSETIGDGYFIVNSSNKFSTWWFSDSSERDPQRFVCVFFVISFSSYFRRIGPPPQTLSIPHALGHDTMLQLFNMADCAAVQLVVCANCVITVVLWLFLVIYRHVWGKSWHWHFCFISVVATSL